MAAPRRAEVAQGVDRRLFLLGAGGLLLAGCLDGRRGAVPDPDGPNIG